MVLRTGVALSVFSMLFILVLAHVAPAYEPTEFQETKEEPDNSTDQTIQVSPEAPPQCAKCKKKNESASLDDSNNEVTMTTVSGDLYNESVSLALADDKLMTLEATLASIGYDDTSAAPEVVEYTDETTAESVTVVQIPLGAKALVAFAMANRDARTNFSYALSCDRTESRLCFVLYTIGVNGGVVVQGWTYDICVILIDGVCEAASIYGCVTGCAGLCIGFGSLYGLCLGICFALCYFVGFGDTPPVDCLEKANEYCNKFAKVVGGGCGEKKLKADK